MSVDVKENRSWSVKLTLPGAYLEVSSVNGEGKIVHLSVYIQDKGVFDLGNVLPDELSTWFNHIYGKMKEEGWSPKR
jgi:hypothetical protein